VLLPPTEAAKGQKQEKEKVNGQKSPGQKKGGAQTSRFNPEGKFEMKK